MKKDTKVYRASYSQKLKIYIDKRKAFFFFFICLLFFLQEHTNLSITLHTSSSKKMLALTATIIAFQII